MAGRCGSRALEKRAEEWVEGMSQSLWAWMRRMGALIVLRERSVRMGGVG